MIVKNEPYRYKDIGFTLKAKIEDWYFQQIISAKASFKNPERATKFAHYDYTVDIQNEKHFIEIKVREYTFDRWPSVLLEKLKYDKLKDVNGLYLNIYPKSNKFRMWSLSNINPNFVRREMPVDYTGSESKIKEVTFLDNELSYLGSVNFIKPTIEDLLSDSVIRSLDGPTLNHLINII